MNEFNKYTACPLCSALALTKQTHPAAESSQPGVGQMCMATVAVKVGGLLCSLKPGWGTEQVAAQVSSLGHPREELSSEGRGVRQTGGLGELGSDPGRRTSPEASQRDPASRAAGL